MPKARIRMMMATVAAVATFAVVPAFADTVSMKADLSGAEEVPPNDSKAGGRVEVTYDTDSRVMTWQGNFTGLSGPPTAAHFHAGEKGKNGGIAVPIFAAGGTSPFEGKATLSDRQGQQLLGGMWYVNVHTEAHRAGEIRGQVMRQ